VRQNTAPKSIDSDALHTIEPRTALPNSLEPSFPTNIQTSHIDVLENTINGSRGNKLIADGGFESLGGRHGIFRSPGTHQGILPTCQKEIYR